MPSKPNKLQSCGHPESSIVGSDDGTHYCAYCAANHRVADAILLLHYGTMEPALSPERRGAVAEIIANEYQPVISAAAQLVAAIRQHQADAVVQQDWRRVNAAIEEVEKVMGDGT